MKIKHREKSSIICPILSLCIGVLTWIHIWSHVTSHVIIAKHKHTNKKGELRKKNNTTLRTWSLGIIMLPQAYSLVVQLYGPPRP